MVRIKYVVDAWAWIEYLVSGTEGKKVKDIVESEGNEIYINSIIMAEVISRTSREGRDIKTAFDAMTSLSVMADINNADFSREVGILHAEMKKKASGFGLADAFVLATARKLNAKVITGDAHFRNVKEAVLIG